MITPGTIVKNLSPNEPVVVNDIRDLGNVVSISYTGVNSKKQSNKVVPKSSLDLYEVVTQQGTYTFDGDPVRFTLYTEAERIRSAYQFDPLFAVNCSIIDPLPHQVEAVYKYLLPLPRIRFLLADDTGAGKTIMTGVLIKHLLLRGTIERILIITPGGLTKQWAEDELGLKFNLSFKLVDRAAFSADPNIFNQSNKLVTSIDFIRNEDVLNVVTDSTWDLVVVDEAHKLSAYDYGQKRYRSKRYEAIEKIAPNAEHLLLLTATPHRGRKDTFRNLLQLIDEDVFSSDTLVKERIIGLNDGSVNRFFLRRLKESMEDWDGKPLFKERHTRTVMYELTPEEKHLYDEVTRYLSTKRQDAENSQNIHVNLALMVMQRRLTSSIYAIKNTLGNRYRALDNLVTLVHENPALWGRRMQIDMELDSLDDYDELTDDERDSLEQIMGDPRQFKLFTTAKTLKEVREERDEVGKLFNLAESLFNSKVEEQKLRKLYEFLRDQEILDGKKLVIFTEHKDTLDYLEEKLKNHQYNVETIYGQMSVDERRKAQDNFAADGHILIATDAAGEGINLQFCNMLINWDIPWNPNRLEQRMGRIHRYGQEQEVYVFNMVAQNTREGRVLQKLLIKLEVIRDQLGSDRVYDVISDVFEGVSLDDIIKTTMYGQETEYDNFIEQKLTKENVSEKLKDQRDQMQCTMVNYLDARQLKESSDETRLQPIYIQRFFERALTHFGGQIEEVESGIVRLTNVPDDLTSIVRSDYNVSREIHDLRFCFDKKIFLNKSKAGRYSKLYYINPGNPIFDALIKMTILRCKEDVLKGTILVSADDAHEQFAFLVKSQITDNLGGLDGENIADERMSLVIGREGQYLQTSPAKLLDMHPPVDFAKTIEPPEAVHDDEMIAWSVQQITLPQFQEVTDKISADVEIRRGFIEEGFTALIAELTLSLEELRGKLLQGNQRVEEKTRNIEVRIKELYKRKQRRLADLEKRKELHMKQPELLGCAYIVPLSLLEFEDHFGMQRDDEVERIAMEISMQHEKDAGRFPEDVSAMNCGFDIRSTDEYHFRRYIEVKGRAATGDIVLTENEMYRLTQLGESAWLYVVTSCKSRPEIYLVANPGQKLRCERKATGIRYFVKEAEWRRCAS